jgi:hypothetical protein
MLRLAERAGATTCAYCHDPLDPARHDCGCGAAYHRDCWAELGKCATLGCAGRADADDRRRGGRCPQCHTTVSQALPWERLGCAGCGAVYHLGCRIQRARCATRGCRSGDHDGWGVPRPPERAPLLGAEQRALLVRSLATSLVAALATWGTLSLTDLLVESALLGGLVALVVSFVLWEPEPAPRARRRAPPLRSRRYELLGRR